MVECIHKTQGGILRTMELTLHSLERIKERGVHRGEKGAIQEMERALSRGKGVEDFDDASIRRYLNNVCNARGKDRFVKVYGGRIYVFGKNDRRLLTVLTFPQKIIRNTNKKKQRFYICED